MLITSGGAMERRQWIADRLIELDKKFSTFATESGVSESTAARWISGECVPSPRNRRRMAKSLRISHKKLNTRFAEDKNSSATDILQNGGETRNDVDRREIIKNIALAALSGCLPSVRFPEEATDLLQETGLPEIAKKPREVQPALQTLASAVLTPSISHIQEQELSIPYLKPALGRATSLFRSCEHGRTAEYLQEIIPKAESGESLAIGDERLHWSALVAEAYQLATSTLLRFGSIGLALVTAERSLKAAERSLSLNRIGASARVMTHALMRSQEAEAGKNLAMHKSAQLEHLPLSNDGPALWSVRGALLLRAAEAAAQSGNISQAYSLLDESKQLAERVGQGADHESTVFNPANVLAHRMAIELEQGNAGRALEAAAAIQLPDLVTVERKTCVQLDIARAFTQCGKYSHAVATLWEVEKNAPEELRLRKNAKAMIRQIQCLAPPTVVLAINDLSTRIGLQALS